MTKKNTFRKIVDVKKKIILTISFFISLLPMLLNQYGGARGVQEISGTINLLNPIGIAAVALFIIGVWVPFKNNKLGNILGGVGVIGIAISEIYTFLTWHIHTITGRMRLQFSIDNVFPEFYVGLAVSVIMVVFYFYIIRKDF